MEIDAQILENFFKKVTLNNKIPSARLISTNEGMFTRLNLIGHIITEGTLAKSAFHKFEENITLDIRDTVRFDKIVKSFKDKMAIGVVDNFIIMSGTNKTANFKLASEIDTYQKTPTKLDWDLGFDLPISFIKEIETNLDNTEADCVELEVKDKKFTAITYGQEDTIKEEMNMEYKDCKFLMAGEYFKKIVEIIDSDSINLSFQDLEKYNENPPIRIVEKGKVHKFTIWVAPFRKDSE